MKEKWYPKETPEDQVAIDKVEEYAIAYCSILTGEECVATGTTEPHVIKEGEVETKWADEVVHRVLMRSKITVSSEHQLAARQLPATDRFNSNSL